MRQGNVGHTALDHLITQRSQVQILSPLPGNGCSESSGCPFFVSLPGEWLTPVTAWSSRRRAAGAPPPDESPATVGAGEFAAGGPAEAGVERPGRLIVDPWRSWLSDASRSSST